MADRWRPSASAVRRVTVSLHGWFGEERRLSVVEPHWYVEIGFESVTGGPTRTVEVFKSASHAEAMAKYLVYRAIVDG